MVDIPLGQRLVELATIAFQGKVADPEPRSHGLTADSLVGRDGVLEDFATITRRGELRGVSQSANDGDLSQRTGKSAAEGPGELGRRSGGTAGEEGRHSFFLLVGGKGGHRWVGFPGLAI